MSRLALTIGSMAAHAAGFAFERPVLVGIGFAIDAVVVVLEICDLWRSRR